MLKNSAPKYRAFPPVHLANQTWQDAILTRPPVWCSVDLPSTVEHATPNIFSDMIEWMYRHLARRDAIVLSVHPQHDRGTGTAANEFAVMAGADRLEGCLLDNGERTNNLDLVNVALNLYSRGVDPGLDFSDVDEIRRAVEHCNHLSVHPRHPYAGDLVYNSFSGLQQDAIKKVFTAHQKCNVWDMPCLPVDPQDLGRNYLAVVRVNSQSGKGGISYLLESEYGLQLPRRLQIEFSQTVQTVMDATRKELTAQDLYALFEREYGLRDVAAPLHQILAEAGGSDGKQVTLSADIEIAGRSLYVHGAGTGPIDAFVEGLNRTTGQNVRVLDYHEHAIGSGAHVQAVAYLELRVGQQTVFGVGMDADIVAASIKAIICGFQRAQAVEKTHAQSLTNRQIKEATCLTN